MNYQEILTVITLLFLLLAAVNLTRYRRKYHDIKKEFGTLTNEKKSLLAECSELKTKISEQVSFANNLTNAEITTKLQTSRTGYHTNGLHSITPERYSYINKLSDSGMKPEEIGNLLSISVQEAEQLVKLSQLSSRH